MAATLDLDTITTHAQQAGAKVLLVGDWAQLSPVSAGGAFHLLAHDRDDVATLHEVRRFTHAWERDASLRLRDGDPAVVDEYLAHGRVQGGDRESMLDLLYEAWRADIDAGLTSLMIAADTETVLDLNRRAQADRIRAGEVAGAGVALADGTTAGRGDVIVTRRNDRHLVAPGGFVKNGDRWHVLAHHARRQPHRPTPRWRRPGRGCPRHTSPDTSSSATPTTAQRAQGRTVDRAHAYLAPAATRETLYVMASRGVQSNDLYVDTQPRPRPRIRPRRPTRDSGGPGPSRRRGERRHRQVRVHRPRRRVDAPSTTSRSECARRRPSPRGRATAREIGGRPTHLACHRTHLAGCPRTAAGTTSTNRITVACHRAIDTSKAGKPLDGVDRSASERACPYRSLWDAYADGPSEWRHRLERAGVDRIEIPARPTPYRRGPGAKCRWGSDRSDEGMAVALPAHGTSLQLPRPALPAPASVP